MRGGPARSGVLGALALAVVVALAGCGGEEERPARTAPPAAEEPGPIGIEEPADSKRVRARDEGGRLAAKPTVSGTADAGAAVIVNGGCNLEGCVVRVAADAQGRWSTPVRLDAVAGEPRVRITAYYRGSVVGPEDRVEVRLAGPEAERDRGGRGGRGGGGGGAGALGGDDDRDGDDPVPPDALDPDPSPAPGPNGSGPRSLVLIGDSLAVGIEDLLPGLLPGWRISSDALTSRPLATGMAILSRASVARGSVVAMSLFTNDDPARTAELEAAVRTSVRRAGPGGCAIWATISRPPFSGRTYAAANALLRRLDAELGPRMTAVPWAETAARNGWLATDRVHGTPEGYRARARMYAEAARACG